jgi:hypothetical protein
VNDNGFSWSLSFSLVVGDGVTGAVWRFDGDPFFRLRWSLILSKDRLLDKQPHISISPPRAEYEQALSGSDELLDVRRNILADVLSNDTAMRLRNCFCCANVLGKPAAPACPVVTLLEGRDEYRQAWCTASAMLP